MDSILVGLVWAALGVIAWILSSGSSGVDEDSGDDKVTETTRDEVKEGDE